MTTTTDPRAAAEEALRLHGEATPGPWATLFDPNDGSIVIYGPGNHRIHDAFNSTEEGQTKALANRDFIARARTLLPILARAVIEGQTERDNLVKKLDEWQAACDRARGAAQAERASADAACAELANLRRVYAAAREVGNDASDEGSGYYVPTAPMQALDEALGEVGPLERPLPKPELANLRAGLTATHAAIDAIASGEGVDAALVAAEQAGQPVDALNTLHVNRDCPAYRPGDATTAGLGLVICERCNPPAGKDQS